MTDDDHEAAVERVMRACAFRSTVRDEQRREAIREELEEQERIAAGLAAAVDAIREEAVSMLLPTFRVSDTAAAIEKIGGICDEALRAWEARADG